MKEIDREQLGEWLSAFLDGELNEKQNQLVERILADDEHARQQLEQLQETTHSVSSLPRHDAPGSIADDIRHHIERTSLLDDWGEETNSPSTWRSPWVRLLSVAAMLTLLVGGAFFVTRSESDSFEEVSRRGAAEPGESETDTVSGSGSFVGTGAMVAKLGDKRVLGALLAQASFEQKLRAGLGIELAKEHRFDTEPVRLHIPSSSASARDEMASRLVSYLADQGLTDVSILSGPGGSKNAEQTAFFYRGRSNLNFSTEGEQQILIRARQHVVQAMLKEIEDSLPGNADILLVAGPATVRGQAQIQEVLSGLHPSVGEDRSPDEPEVERLADRSPIDDLLRLIMVDPDAFAELEAKDEISARAESVLADADVLPSTLTVVDAKDSASTSARLADRLNEASDAIGKVKTREAEESQTGQPAEEMAAAGAHLANRPHDLAVDSVAGSGETQDRHGSTRSKHRRSSRAVKSLVDRRMDVVTKTRRESAKPNQALGRDKLRHKSALVKKGPVSAKPIGFLLGDPTAFVTLVIQVQVQEPKAKRGRASRSFLKAKKKLEEKPRS